MNNEGKSNMQAVKNKCRTNSSSTRFLSQRTIILCWVFSSSTGTARIIHPSSNGHGHVVEVHIFIRFLQQVPHFLRVVPVTCFADNFDLQVEPKREGLLDGTRLKLSNLGTVSIGWDLIWIWDEKWTNTDSGTMRCCFAMSRFQARGWNSSIFPLAALVPTWNFAFLPRPKWTTHLNAVYVPNESSIVHYIFNGNTKPGQQVAQLWHPAGTIADTDCESGKTTKNRCWTSPAIGEPTDHLQITSGGALPRPGLVPGNDRKSSCQCFHRKPTAQLYEGMEIV